MKGKGNMELRFYRCEVCGQIIAIVNKTSAEVYCCGEPMAEIIPNTVDAAHEKHVPVCSVHGNTVEITVGSTEHPMTKEHHIEWIAIRTKTGNQRKVLSPGCEPKACFALCEGDEIVAAYAYCNLHGLWKGCTDG